ncbi:MAG: tRNA (5-methylaminomethyl-2-thiouridine)(34)-methyltransferase MnmD [Pseudomonadota bacterium]
MAELEWRDELIPVSTRFDDPYYSCEDGRAETDYVFIGGNNLIKRWPNLSSCTIAELGFGTGLNFLQTVFQWQKHKSENAKLHFVSFEQFPLDSSSLEKALSAWPDLKPLADRLLDSWCNSPDIVETDFSQGIKLVVHLGDANKLLRKLGFKADAWYLDGFSPAKNPELWNESLMKEVAEHTVVDGTFATYTAAGYVRRGLSAAGFEVQKTKGFGSKRDMLTGRLVHDIHVADRH